jgi:predicted lipase
LGSHGSKKPKILVTGVSLGGALAAFSTYDLVTYFKHTKKEVTILSYTFGQPRIGNENFAKTIDEAITIYRVVHNSDPVPHLPPRYFIY